MGMSSGDIVKIVGMGTYLEPHGDRDRRPNLDNISGELVDWKLSVTFTEETVDVLCCPPRRAKDAKPVAPIRGRPCN